MAQALRLAAFAALASVALGRPATASPLEDPSEGSVVFTGPGSAHPSSIFINPAALGFSGQGWHIFLGSSLRLDAIRVDRYAVDPATGATGDGPGASPVTPSPGGMLAAVIDVGDRAHVGFALHAPFAERFPAAGAALGYHSLGGYQYSMLISAAGTYRIMDRLIFGLGGSFGYNRFRFEVLRDSALEAGSGAERGIASDCDGQPCGLEHPAAAEHLTIASTANGGLDLFVDPSENFGMSVGLALEIWGTHDWWATLAYVGPPGVISNVTTTGEVALERAPRDGGGTVRGDAEVTFGMPQAVWLGLRGPLLPGWELVTSLRWQDMSRSRELDIRFRGPELEAAGLPEWYPRYRGLRDTVQATAGLEMDPSAPLRLGGRVRLESGSTSPHRTSPLAVEGGSLGLGAGIEWRLGQNWVVSGGYDLTVFAPVDTASSAFDPLGRLGCVDSGYALSACEAARDGRALPSAAGRYDRLRQVITFGLRWDSL